MQLPGVGSGVASRSRAPWLLVLAAVLPFLPFVGSPFASDDQYFLETFPFTHDLGNVRFLFSHDYFERWPEAPGWRPLAVVSHMLDYAVWGLRPAGHRLPNLLVHAGSCLMLYRLLLALVRRDDVALAVGLLFALHPVHSENLYCASFRRDSTAGLCLLLALIAYRRWSTDRRFVTTGAAWSALASFVVGVGFKEGVLMFPLLLWVHDRLGLHPDPALRRPWGRYAPFLLVITVYAAFRVWGLPPQIQTIPAEASTWTGQVTINVMTAFKCLVTYARLAVWPYPLVVGHQISPVRSLDGATLGGMGLLAAYGWILWRSGRSHPVATFGLAWLGLTYLPTAQLMPGLLTQPVAERYAYVPSIGLALAVADWLARRPPEVLVTWRPLFLFVLATLGGIDVLRGIEWSDPGRLIALNNVRYPESYLVYLGRGHALLNQNRLEEARAAYEKALVIDEGGQGAHNNLGVIFLELGDLEKAREEFAWVRRHSPRNPTVCVNQGHVEMAARRFRLAEVYYRQALALAPGFENAQDMLEQAVKQSALQERHSRHR